MAESPETRTAVAGSGPDGTARFACAQCAAELEYAPGTTVLECPYCGLRNEIAAADRAVAEMDYAEHLRRLESEQDQVDVALVKCGACGAETERPPNMDAFECAFCGADMLTAEGSARLIKPRSLLPFHVTPEQAHQIFRKWISGLWFAPSKLKRFARSGGRVQGVYLPFWTYDCNTVTSYTGQRGEHYWVTERYTTRENGKTVRKTRRKRKTRWYPASGVVHNAFDDLLVCASRSLPEASVAALEPWDLPSLVPYRDEYVAGFRAEKYQVDLPGGFEEARVMMEPPIRRTIRGDIGGDEQRIHSMDTAYHDITFKHLLLPVWISAYRFRDKVYRVLINARTGELEGQRPWSAWKIVGAVLGAAAAVGVIALLFAVLR
ncbi:MAG: TFIIB-type zinc ribbon-containing protein [Planctomycetota bacterium]